MTNAPLSALRARREGRFRHAVVPPPPSRYAEAARPRGPDSSGAPLSLAADTIAAMATTYRITYRVLPAGVGPDDYEPKDLEKRVELVELSDPEPAGMVAGKMLYYGPKDTEIREALKDRIPEGAYPIVLDCRRPDAED